MTKRNVILFSDGDDMAGVNYGLMQAINRHSQKYQARQVRGTNNYIDYPVDIHWMGNNTLVNSLYDEADIIHISEYPWALDGNNAPKIWEPRLIPMVVQQHGTPFRNNPQRYLALARKKGFTQAVSTVDLLVDPSLLWLPNPVDVGEMQRLRREHYSDDGTIRIGQAPTNPSIKNTNEFIDACEDLTKSHGIEYHVFQGLKWRDNLAAKARMDIWFDQLTLGYGNNGIEAMAMGIPTVGGFADKLSESRYVGLVGNLPYIPATPATLGEVLRNLVDDVQSRVSGGRIGFETVQRMHGERAVASSLEKIYDKTINEFEVKNGLSATSRTTSI